MDSSPYICFNKGAQIAQLINNLIRNIMLSMESILARYTKSKEELLSSGFNRKEVTALTESTNKELALYAILELRKSFSDLIEDTANEIYSLSRDARHEMNQSDIRDYINRNDSVLKHPAYSEELATFCLDEYFE